MKKLAAILMITLFLFNLVGYRIWFNYAQKQSDLQLEASLDNNQYNDADLITLRVPISVPYQNDQESFERVNGEIKVDGKIYKYVKRRVLHGELVLLCLPNQNKMKLQNARDEFFKYANDLAQNNTSKKSDQSKTGVSKNLAFEYELIDQMNFGSLHDPVGNQYSSYQFGYYPYCPAKTVEQPPELL